MSRCNTSRLESAFAHAFLLSPDMELDFLLMMFEKQLLTLAHI